MTAGDVVTIKVAGDVVPPKGLTAEFVRSLLAYDPVSGLFHWKVFRGRKAKAGDLAGCLDTHGHRQIMICARSYAAARLAWLIMTGEWPAQQVDHKNRQPDDNRWDNLREATAVQNRCDADAPVGSSGLPGVQWHKRQRKWNAVIRLDGQRHHLGCFTDRNAAFEAYCEASLRLHGEFSRLAP